MTSDLAQAYANKISALLKEKLRARGSFEQQAKRAASKLPRKVRKALKSLVEVQALAENPKLARQIDETALRQAGDLVIEHLEAIDPWDRFKGRVLNWLGGIAAVLILGFIIWVWFARQEGWI